MGVRIIDPTKSDKLSDFTNIFFNLRKHKGITIEQAVKTIKRDLFFAAMMVKENLADGSVAGSLLLLLMLCEQEFSVLECRKEFQSSRVFS